MPVLPSGYPFDFTDMQTADGTHNRGGYCSVADMKVFLYNLIDDPLITANQTLLETIIADVAQDLDRALETMYVTPITGTNSIEHLRFMNKHMAVAMLLTLSASNSTQNVEATHTNATIHHETASQRLDDIARGVTQLFDAVTKPGGERPAFPAGIAARWNPDVDPGTPASNAQTSGPLFGTRYDNPLADIGWVS